jgi:hypothetical protein
MRWELSRSVVPPGGYRYEQGLGDGSVSVIEGGSLEEVLGKVLAYRIANVMVLASGVEASEEAVEKDYHGQVCGKWPWICKPLERGEIVRSQQTSAGGFEMLIVRMQRWFGWLRGKSLGWVDMRVAYERGNVCLGCPQNVYWESGCGECNRQIRVDSAALRGSRRLGIDGGLKGCRAWGTLQEVAVWLEEPGGEKRYEAPGMCWRVKA